MNIFLHLVSAVIALFFLLLLPLSARVGILMNYLILLPLVLLPMVAMHRLGGAMRKAIFLKHFKNPFASIPHLLGFLLRALTWWVVAYTVSVSVIPGQFTEDQFKVIRWMIWMPPALFTLLALLPNTAIRPAAPLFHALLLAYTLSSLSGILLQQTPPSDAIVLAPPGDGEWFVVQGGDSPLINHHYHAGSQRYAIDLVRPEDLLLEEHHGQLIDFASFGTPALAPIGGKIIAAVDGIADEELGETNELQIAGNHIVIEHQPGVYCLLAHLQQGSLIVEQGQQVKTGDVLATCGNSGNTSQPHHHLQLMTKADFLDEDNQGIPFVIPTQRGTVQPQRHDILGTASMAP